MDDGTGTRLHADTRAFECGCMYLDHVAGHVSPRVAHVGRDGQVRRVTARLRHRLRAPHNNGINGWTIAKESVYYLTVDNQVGR